MGMGCEDVKTKTICQLSADIEGTECQWQSSSTWAAMSPTLKKLSFAHCSDPTKKVMFILKMTMLILKKLLFAYCSDPTKKVWTRCDDVAHAVYTVHCTLCSNGVVSHI